MGRQVSSLKSAVENAEKEQYSNMLSKFRGPCFSHFTPLQFALLESKFKIMN